jgi:hypothetical protein
VSGRPAESGSTRDVAGWILDNVAATLTIIGVTTYVVLRLSAVIFYSRLGFTPDDVGLGYVETLSWMMFALLLIVALRVLVKLIVPRALARLKVWARRRRGRPGPSYQEQRAAYVRASGGFRRLLDPADLKVTLPLVLLPPLLSALITGPAAADGRPAPYSPFNPIWRAEAARVHPLGRADVDIGDCVLFVGEDDGIVALYDPATRRSWRLPTSAVAIETGGALEQIEQVPEDCPR